MSCSSLRLILFPLFLAIGSAAQSNPQPRIVDLAAELNADLLVIGARGHSTLYERLVRSRAERIMKLASCPVLVVK